MHQVSDSVAHCRFKFETSNGAIGEHPPSSYNFTRVALPPLAVVKKIRVYTDNNQYVDAIEFFDKNRVSILKAGRQF